MIFSKGFIYRFGLEVKDFGEWLGHIKVFGIFIFRWCSSAVINLGLWIRDSILNCAVGEM